MTEKELVVEVEPFPTDRHGTIVLGNTSSPNPDADADAGDETGG
ncbi:hypothetical protein [Rhodococcus rhodochrous]|nr:hypothetical protein [Rhodococcus rhodochrous]MDJ0401339.1 hypothetical protein [Rhodococcus rhodochrous]